MCPGSSALLQLRPTESELQSELSLSLILLSRPLKMLLQLFSVSTATRTAVVPYPGLVPMHCHSLVSWFLCTVTVLCLGSCAPSQSCVLVPVHCCWDAPHTHRQCSLKCCFRVSPLVQWHTYSWSTVSRFLCTVTVLCLGSCALLLRCTSHPQKVQFKVLLYGFSIGTVTHIQLEYCIQVPMHCRCLVSCWAVTQTPESAV